jgi:hypothetical protein
VADDPRAAGRYLMVHKVDHKAVDVLRPVGRPLLAHVELVRHDPRPGPQLARSFGIRSWLRRGRRKSVTTVAALMSASNRSWVKKRTRSLTPRRFAWSAATRLSFASISTPTPTAP